MFKKTNPNPQLDIFTATSMQLGSRASKIWTKRGPNGQFMDGKQDGTPFKGVRKEK